MITLPMKNQRWPLFRLLTRPTWGGTVASGGGWQAQTMEREGPRASGFILLDYNRALLPQLGTAKILYRFGTFSGQIVGASSGSVTRQRAGTGWDPAIDSMTLPELAGKEIRIQACYPNEEGNPTTWRTVWWGDCEYQLDQGWGGSVVPSGDRVFHCIDAFARTRRWRMDKHGYFSTAGQVAPAAGHPGYNVGRSSPAQAAGNKSAAGTWAAAGDGTSGRMFSLPGAGQKWTDTEAINEALTNHRPTGQPHWILSGAVDLFDTSSPWPVSEGESVFDVVTRICSRSRGRGAVLPTWNDDSGSPDNPLACSLTAFAQLARDVTYQDPAASQVAVTGATSRGTTAVVDIIGDHRLVPGSLTLGDAEQFRVDYLVTQGEQIEVLATLEHGVSIEPGFNPGERTAFLALAIDKRVADRWRPVFQLHRLKRGFTGNLGNGNGGGQASGDYRCKDDGSISAELQDGTIGNSALSMIDVLDDLPLYEGYKYDSTPLRDDGQSAESFDGAPARRVAVAYLRDTTGDKFQPMASIGQPAGMKFLPDGILLEVGDDQTSGRRFLSGSISGVPIGGSIFNRVVFTVGLRLPHRIRMATGNPALAVKRMTITHPNIHLWLAHPGAIWSLDDAAGGATLVPKRNAGGGAPGILRDDRSALARLHALAASWYMPEVDLLGAVVSGSHRNASWSLRCCGDIPTGIDYDGGGVVYPTLGKVVTFLTANGQRNELNTPVSSISYDNTNGTTTWTTDWQDLDLRNA